MRALNRIRAVSVCVIDIPGAKTMISRIFANLGGWLLQLRACRCAGMRNLAVTSLLAFFGLRCFAQTNLVSNGEFENGMDGWRVWSRQSGGIKASVEATNGNRGKVLRLDHTGTNDWSLEPGLRLPVQPGDVFELEASIRVEGKGSATLCVSTWDASGQNKSWAYGEKTVRATKDVQHLRTRLVIPPGVSQINPRLIGNGAATVWVGKYSLMHKPGVDSIRNKNLPAQISLTNDTLEIAITTGDGAMRVVDRRTHRRWVQVPTHANIVVTDAHSRSGEIELALLDVPSGMILTGTIRLDEKRPEFTLTLTGAGELSAPMRYPFPFETQKGDRLIIPMNEGISYPVDDATIEPFRLIGYGGHGICMAFWGVADEKQGHGVIIGTPDDAAIQMERIDHKLVVAPEWDSQKGQFGYARQLRYFFFDQGGYVAIAKRYREYAREIGRLKTLEEKRRENPNVDLLIGAVNVWNWDADPAALVKEMQGAGIEHILWSRGGSPEALKTLNDMKVLTSRYDIYQDVMDPANFAAIGWTHGDWTTSAWPQDIITRADGDWLRGWGVEGKKGDWFYCGVICDKRAVDYARQRVPADLAKHPYLCRFIDTTTAAPWNECYNPQHPMTRTESREWKMKLLDYMSHDSKLVTGCETGHDASVPFLHYFEGMLSLGPYRVADAGRNMEKIYTEAPELVAKFQLGQAYRLPLWELVYHDCVVAQWYWGDYNNKIPSLWDKRDLFNVLYGTPPMFMFKREIWKSQKERFVQSYRNTCPYVRSVGYSEMLDHRILTADRNVQQTVFANGTVITVNFGNAPFQLSSDVTVGPMGFNVRERK